MSADTSTQNSCNTVAEKRGLFHLINELRRRRVCRAATMYAVVMWLVCQVVELVYVQLGLPEWTLKFVIVVGVLGFPIALILSWLIDITPDGLVVDAGRCSEANAENRRPWEQGIDCGLLAVALFIGFQLASGVLTADASNVEARAERIAVVPFRVASGSDADALSQGLVAELQHELARRENTKVIASEKPYLTEDTMSLGGAVSVGVDTVRVTVTMMDNKTGEVTWSRVFQQRLSGMTDTSAQLAQDIVAALPAKLRVSDASTTDYST